TSSSRWTIRRSTPTPVGSLITVSIRNARPNLKYCLTRECLYRASMVTSTPLVTTRVAKTPVVVLVLGILRPKISSTFSGRPRSRLSATRDSKNARPLPGWSNTIVRDTSICRIDKSHQYPCSRSAGVNGNGIRGHHRSANAAMSAGPSRSQIACNPDRVVGGGESVGQRGESDPGPGRLLLGPLMSVQPDLDRIRQVGTDLDERRAELLVPQVEVETRDATVRPTPLEMRGTSTIRGPGMLTVALPGDDGVVVVDDDRGVERPRPVISGGALVVMVTG